MNPANLLQYNNQPNTLQLYILFLEIYILFISTLQRYKKYILKKYVINKLSQDKSRKLPIMQQSTRKSQTTYSAFKNSYLIHVLFKSNVLNNLGKLDKISTYKNIYKKNLQGLQVRSRRSDLGSKKNTLILHSIFENS